MAGWRFLACYQPSGVRMNPEQRPEVVQVDREAAASTVVLSEYAEAIIAGRCDDSRAVQAFAAHRQSAETTSLEHRDKAIRWANQSVQMLQDAFFPLADALRELEAYLRNTPHQNAIEAAAASKALAKFDGASHPERRSENG